MLSVDKHRHAGSRNSEYGFNAPSLSLLRHPRTSRALTAMLRHNLDPSQSELGLGRKGLVGLVFAEHADNDHLREQGRRLAERHLSPTQIIEIAVWISVSHLLHRLAVYQGIDAA